MHKNMCTNMEVQQPFSEGLPQEKAHLAAAATLTMTEEQTLRGEPRQPPEPRWLKQDKEEEEALLGAEVTAGQAGAGGAEREREPESHFPGIGSRGSCC